MAELIKIVLSMLVIVAVASITASQYKIGHMLSSFHSLMSIISENIHLRMCKLTCHVRLLLLIDIKMLKFVFRTGKLLLTIILLENMLPCQT